MIFGGGKILSNPRKPEREKAHESLGDVVIGKGEKRHGEKQSPARRRTELSTNKRRRGSFRAAVARARVYSVFGF